MSEEYPVAEVETWKERSQWWRRHALLSIGRLVKLGDPEPRSAEEFRAIALELMGVDETHAAPGCDHPYLSKVSYPFEGDNVADRWICVSDGAPGCHWTITIERHVGG
jgi:hypothetical protein